VIFLPGGISIKIIKNIEEFEALQETWNSLLNNCEDRNMFLSWDWLFSWWTHFGDGHTLHILLILKDDSPVGIAPFMISEYRYCFIKYRVLENICARGVDYGGIIFVGNKGEIVKAIIDFLVSFLEDYRYIVRMSQLPENAIFYQEFRKLILEYPDKITFNETHFTSCPYLIIPESWEKYCASLKQKRRHNLKSTIKKINPQFNVDYISITPSNSLFEKYFNDFRVLHQKRWDQFKLPSKFSDNRVIQFYRDISNRFTSHGCLDFSIMKINNTVASVVFGFIFNKKYYCYTTAFDAQYDYYGLGKIHFLHTIKESIKKELKEVDFLKGEEPYKFFWTQTSRKNFEILLSKKRYFQRFRMLIFQKFLRFHEITQRTLKENYYLYLKQKKDLQ
jgi:CelD/BcsL family acetyltransferase involved in cellulose biosynthesis